MFNDRHLSGGAQQLLPVILCVCVLVGACVCLCVRMCAARLCLCVYMCACAYVDACLCVAGSLQLHKQQTLHLLTQGIIVNILL
jgi:hypothetical protein